MPTIHCPWYIGDRETILEYKRLTPKVEPWPLKRYSILATCLGRSAATRQRHSRSTLTRGIHVWKHPPGRSVATRQQCSRSTVTRRVHIWKHSPATVSPIEKIGITLERWCCSWRRKPTCWIRDMLPRHASSKLLRHTG